MTGDPAGSGQPLASLAGVVKRYTDDAPVLRGLDLTLEASEAVALVGRSGSGKTTLLNLIAGLVTPDAGEVRVAGFDPARASERDRARFRRGNLGVVFQAFNLLPTLTVAENLEFPLALAGLPAGGRARKLLATLGLESMADRLPTTLSGGEQQRVAVARALIHQPKLVLADEPTGNLDLSSAHQVIELLVDASRSAGAGLLLITHSSEISARMDRTLTLEDGVLVGQPAEGRPA
ncbi:MAG: ABC transporter ATP-binding protein [Pseudomonadota bacterium]